MHHLESERGYHVDLPHANVDLHHFILSASESFVILPKADGALRLAGTRRSTTELATLP